MYFYYLRISRFLFFSSSYLFLTIFGFGKRVRSTLKVLLHRFFKIYIWYKVRPYTKRGPPVITNLQVSFCLKLSSRIKAKQKIFLGYLLQWHGIFKINLCFCFGGYSHSWVNALYQWSLHSSPFMRNFYHSSHLCPKPLQRSVLRIQHSLISLDIFHYWPQRNFVPFLPGSLI